MKKLIIAAIAVCAMGFSEAQAQKVIKDASGSIFMDMSDMPAGTFTTSTLNTIGLVDGSANRVYKKLQIAKADLPTKMSWAAACGLAPSFNTTTAVGQAQGQLNTGCKAYSAEGNAGKWRVPTQRELMTMWIMQDILVNAGATSFASGFYMNSTESDTSNSWYINSGAGGQSSAGGKAGDYYYFRCVREVN